jgi:hypothetical protein
MRALLVVSLLVFLAVPARAEVVSRLERPESVAPLLRTLRGQGLRPRARSATPRRLYVVVTQLTPERRAALEAAGLAIELPAPGAAGPAWYGGELVQGTASAEGEAALRALPFVLRVDLPGMRWPSVGSVTTAGDGVHRVEQARAVVPGAGSGVSVGVISDGVGRLHESIASGDLPPSVELLSAGGPAGGDGTEGTAMLEIVHDLAPGARLLFSGPRTSAEMVTAIDALAAAGAQVIVDDLIFTDEPKFVDGPVALAARRFAEAGGLYVTAGGNFARSHWIGDYRRGTSPGFAGASYRGVHQFRGGDAGDTLRVPTGAELFAVLQWNEQYGGARRDFDLLLARSGPGDDLVLAASTEVQDGGGNPYEALRWANDGPPTTVYLAIAEFQSAGAGGTRIDLHVFSRSAIDLEYVVPRDSIFGHAAVEEVLSVAAATPADPGSIEVFSSRGPATVFFPRREARLVPRLAALNGVETAVGRSGFFSNPFFGTSASAPHVAGCAALVLGTGATSAAASAALIATALDVGAAGADLVSGAGLVDCGAAARLASGTGRPPAVSAVQGAFSPAGTVFVSGGGTDADADVRRVTARVFDAVGTELARAEQALVPAGTEFQLGLTFRDATLAGARDVVVEAVDATGLTSAPARAALACPSDGSLGDAFCGIGDLLARLGAFTGRGPARLVRDARATARALTRAGAATSSARARGLLRRAEARLARIVRRAGVASTDPAAVAALAAEAQALRDRVRLLSQTFTSS